MSTRILSGCSADDYGACPQVVAHHRTPAFCSMTALVIPPGARLCATTYSLAALNSGIWMPCMPR